MKTKTTAKFQRQNKIDNQLTVLIPKGTEIEIEDLEDGMYKIFAAIPITKNHDTSIRVYKSELKSFT
jgi:uncharacterized protein involved in tellurium resistance